MMGNVVQQCLEDHMFPTAIPRGCFISLWLVFGETDKQASKLQYITGTQGAMDTFRKQIITA